jgi:predicted RNase H-like nuclease (RuvC/YqgF family)
MNFVEQEFGRLKEETMVSSDISVLYEKVTQLEQISNQADQFREQVAFMQSQLMTLEQTIRDEGFDTQNKYIPEKWEWQDLNDSIIRIETLNQTIQNKQWEIDDLKNRLAYLEANNHNH